MQKYHEIQAVVLTDSFQTRFHPLSQECPKILFPLVNEKLIEYTLLWLEQNKIKNIILLIKNGKNQIETYIKERDVSQKIKSKVEIQLVYTPDAKSIGDALRELHTYGIIHSDFILIQGDTVTNVNLQAALQKYFERKDQNKSNILTSIVHKRNKASSQLYDEDDYYSYTIDSKNQILQLDNLSSKINIKFSKDRIKMEKGQLENPIIRLDLVDSQIYICSVDVLKAFEENFMHNSIKDDFMKEMIHSEIKEEALHIYETPHNEISLCVKNPRLYYLTCQLVLQGYFKPFTPNARFWKESYYYNDFYRYFGTQTKLTQGVSNVSALGKNTLIGNKTKIINSIIGSNCIIGDDCIIKNCIIFDDVKICEKCEINNSIIANRVVVNAGCSVEKGTLISFDVQVKSHIKIPENSRIAFLNKNQENEKFYQGQFLELGDPLNSIGKLQSYYKLIAVDKSPLGEEPSDEKQNKPIDINRVFYEEIKQIILECSDANEDIEKAQLMIDTMKLNYNKTLSQCIEAIVPALFNSLLETSLEQPSQKVEAIKSKLSISKTILNKYLHGSEEAQSLINEIEDFCIKNENFKNFIHIFFQCAFQSKLLKSQDLLDWEIRSQESIEPDIKNFLQLNSKFLTWLKQQDQEEEEDEEEEEEEEEQEQEEEEKEEEEEDGNQKDRS